MAGNVRRIAPTFAHPHMLCCPTAADCAPAPPPLGLGRRGGPFTPNGTAECEPRASLPVATGRGQGLGTQPSPKKRPSVTGYSSPHGPFPRREGVGVRFRPLASQPVIRLSPPKKPPTKTQKRKKAENATSRKIAGIISTCNQPHPPQPAAFRASAPISAPRLSRCAQ